MSSPTTWVVPPPLPSPESFHYHTPILTIIFLVIVACLFCCGGCIKIEERQPPPPPPPQMLTRRNRPTNNQNNNDDIKIGSLAFTYGSSLTIVVVKPASDRPAVIGSDSCSVCLEGFKLGDECRVLINCNHVFHKPCVDKWLSTNRHCPLCRDSVQGASTKALDDIV